MLSGEIRVEGRRVGFEVEALGGSGRGTLAHVERGGPPRVGRYGVDLEALERVALPEFRRDADVVLIDELGKMELMSAAFREAVLELFESRRAVIATVHVFRHPLTDGLKARSDVEVVRLTRAGRDGLPESIVERLV
jgi:nucleoside-triphosphatase